MNDQEKEEAQQIIRDYDGALCHVNVAMLELKKANQVAQDFYAKLGKQG